MFSEQIVSFIIFTSISRVFSQNIQCSRISMVQIFPDPARCDRFFICVLFLPVPVQCYENNIFNPSTLTCVPGNSDTCEFGEITSTLPTTTENSGQFDKFCHNVFFGARSYLKSITKFVGCVRGRGEMKQCYDDEYFDSLLNECVSKKTKTETTTRTTSTTTKFDEHCDGIFDGFVEHPDDCSRYIHCVNGLKFAQKQCSYGKIFDVESQGYVAKICKFYFV